ncbi:MAG: PQQ-binding-like beta-propeller repeat protein, partial [Patescibacteria group bacterium]
EFNSRPVLDSSGNIYIGRADGLAKYSSAGNLIWLFSPSADVIEKAVYTPPLITSNGTIYFRGALGLYAVNQDGQLRWRYALSGTSGNYAALAILSDGTIITQLAEKITAINQDATLKWIFDPGRAMNSSNSIGAFVVDSSDNIFVTIDNYIYKISAAGSLIWEKNLGSEYSSLALGPDNTLYVSSASWVPVMGFQGGFYALDVNDGSTKWSDVGSFNNHAELAPVVDSSNKVYVIMSYGGAWVSSTKLQSYNAANATSTPGWTSANLGPYLAAPILTSDGKIYVTDQKTLKTFSASDGALLGSFNAEDNGDLYTYFGAVGRNGTIYTANAYILYAIDD